MKAQNLLTENTVLLIQKTLHAQDKAELITRGYGTTSAKADFNREDTQKYANRNRGSVRILRGNFYTPKEYEDFVAKALALKLP